MTKQQARATFQVADQSADQDGVVVAPFPLAAMRVVGTRGRTVHHDPAITLASLERAQSLRLAS